MILPAEEYRRTRIVVPEKLHQGLDGVIYGLLGRRRRRGALRRSLAGEAEKIHEAAKVYRHDSDRRLREKLDSLRIRFRRQERSCERLLPEALALMVEAAERALGLRPYPAQVMGAMALYKGYLAEMATGEGKSLTACLPAVLAAWTGRPFHLVTVNDYLAERDAVEMHPFYTFCGVTVGTVLSPMAPRERRLHYQQGVVYTTLKELVADFLRDRLILGHLHHPSRRLLRQALQSRVCEPDGVVLRGIDTAIVDEADSVLIDEAVTPLIISRAEENKPLMEACRNAYRIACTLNPGTEYRKDLKYREINLTDQGLKRIEEEAHFMPGLWRGPSRRTELVEQALSAKEFYTRDKEYVIQDGKVTIVDEFTGRLMPNRTWRHGLHQAVEAKEGLEVNNPSETLARLSFQRFFRFFHKLSGMTGTAREATKEFWHIYKLPVLSIPTNRPCIRNLLPDSYFPDEESKWNAIVEEIVRFNQTGRPLLVGTRSVKASERLAERLSERGLVFNLLNAVRHKEEARIVAAAGEEGRITIATNMAGRGTDIKLGRSVAGLGGLHVMATERHESGRIDRQLYGRCGRQGDPGSAQAFISVEDELIRRYVPAGLRKRLASALRSQTPGAARLGEAALSYAQGAAERLAYRRRVNVLQQDTWLEEALSFSGPGGEF